MSVSVSVKSASSFADIDALIPEVSAAHDTLLSGTGKGAGFLGWLDLPQNALKSDELGRVLSCAKKIRNDSEVLLVIGIGGSYLGARAAIEFIRSPNYNLTRRAGDPLILFVGNSLSSDQLAEAASLLGGKDFSINIISKSGTTTEPAIAFRFFRDLIEKKYGAAAKDRIYATTDRARGALKSLADQNGYQTFVIPDDVGGRFSVLTPVGLLPIAAAGIDVRAMLEGAAAMAGVAKAGKSSPCHLYAAARNALYRKGFTTEILAAYEPRFRYVAEWWKQLYGESEGKDGKGIFPASVDLTADLHSMGQYIQEGLRNIFETVVLFERTESAVTIPAAADDSDALGFLAGRGLSEINLLAAKGTRLAHVDGGVPNLVIEASDTSARTFGELVYFFEFACGLSGYTLGVNPFDQPGVEAYKKNMFALIGKPGYEAQKSALEARL